MSEPDAIRCVGCGLLNPPHLRTCHTCGTLLPRTGSAFAASAPATAKPADLRERVLGAGRLFLAILGLAIGGALAVVVGVPPLTLDVAMTTLFGVGAIVCVIAARHDVIPLLGRTGGWRGGLAALLGFGLLVAFGAIYFPALRALGLPMVQTTSPYVAAGWPVWAPYISIAVCPAVFEELVFRGYVMVRLDLLLTPRETLVVQAVLFSLLHLGLAIFPSHFLIGLVLGMLRRRTGSLYPGMAVHMTWNAAVVWRASRTQLPLIGVI